jgi:potassium efflux system protein
VRSAAAPRARTGGLLLAAVLSATLLGAATGGAQEASPTPAPSPTPFVIPVPEVATRAEETGARLRAIEESLQPAEDVQRIDRESAAHSDRIQARFNEHVAALEAGPALRALMQMTATWQAERNTLSAWSQSITGYANELEHEIQELGWQTDSWTATLARARTANAPATVIERIQATLAAIRTTRTDVERYRAQILALQDRIAREIATCDQAMDRITTYRKKEVGQVFNRDQEPLLEGIADHGIRGTGAAIVHALRDQVQAMPEFAARAAPWLVFQLFLLVALALTFRQAQIRARSWVENDAGLERAARIFNYPYSAALIVTDAIANWSFPWAPDLVSQIIGVLTLIPVARMVHGLIHRRLRPVVYALASLFLLDRVRDVVAPVPQFEQSVLMVQMAAGALAVAWMLHRHIFDVDKDDVDPLHVRTAIALRTAARVMLVSFAISFAAGLAGYMRLAHMLGSGTLGAVYLAAALFACVRALDGLIAFALRARPLKLLRMVRRHRPSLQRRLWHLLIWLGAIGWLFVVLYQFQVLDLVVDPVRRVLTSQLTVGAISVSLGDVIAFLLTIWLSFQLSRFVRFALDEDVYPHVDFARGVPYAISSLVHYVLLISGTLIAFAAMGIDLSRFSILAGALGVGVGFGLQNIVNNFVSGLILLFERPIQVGDNVQVSSMATFGAPGRRLRDDPAERNADLGPGDQLDAHRSPAARRAQGRRRLRHRPRPRPRCPARRAREVRGHRRVARANGVLQRLRRQLARLRRLRLDRAGRQAAGDPQHARPRGAPRAARRRDRDPVPAARPAPPLGRSRGGEPAARRAPRRRWRRRRGRHGELSRRRAAALTGSAPRATPRRGASPPGGAPRGSAARPSARGRSRRRCPPGRGSRVLDGCGSRCRRSGGG